MSHKIQLAIALERAGWHPGAWRSPDAPAPEGVTSPAYWRSLLKTADDAGLVLATIEDRLEHVGPVENAGRLDAVLLASFLAPVTRRIGIVPTATTAHPEPFHVATGIQTLDYASLGRAGVRLVAGSTPAERANFGRRADGPDGLPASGRVEDSPEYLAAFREAGEFAEVLRALWDSWEDGAIVRDIATGRFVDADRIHHINFAGEFFSVTGGSIVPRSPQGQPIIAALAHQTVAYRFAVEHADVIFVTPSEPAGLAGIRAEIDRTAAEVGRDTDDLRIFVDLVVLIEETTEAARAALTELDSLAGEPLASDARIVAGSPADVLEGLRAFAAAGADGVRLRPARQPADSDAIATRIAPLAREAGLLDETDASTLRGRLGLERPVSRFTIARETKEAVQ